MRSNTFTIIRKELSRFFRDPRMVFTTLILPGLLIYFIYTFMGDGFSIQLSTPEEYVYNIEAVSFPDSVRTFAERYWYVSIREVGSEEEGQAHLAEGTIDLLAVFPEGFDEMMSPDYRGDVPNVDLFYSSAKVASREAYTNMSSILNTFETSLTNKFDINNTQKTYDVATAKESTSMVFTMILPLLLMIFLISGCMTVAPESIAGEKERGTIATLLVTPMSRSELALGKILSLSFISLLSGLSSFLGTMLSAEKLVGGSTGSIDASAYSITDYLVLMGVILSTIMFIVSVISIISAYAKTVKEASTAVLPLMVIVMMIGVSSMFGSGAPKSILWYFLPLYNSVQCMAAIFSFSAVSVNLVITICVNVMLSIVLMFILAKMLSNEKIMFSK